MERSHVFVILGSGLMVFGLAALSGFLIFSPASVIGQRWFGVQNEDTSSNNNYYLDPQPQSLPHSTDSLDNFSVQHIVPSDKISTPPPEMQNKDLNKSSSSALEDFSLRYIAPPEKVSTPVKIQNEDLNRSSSMKNIPEVSSNFTYQSNEKVTSNTNTTILNNNNVGSLSPKRSLKTPLYPKRSGNNQQKITKNDTHSAPQHNTDYSHRKLNNISRTSPSNPTGSSYYWIQVGSYSSLGRAKKSQRLLKDLGVSGNIEIYHLDNKYVYRLKVGAWQSKKEALNFVQYFKGSYPIFSGDAFVVG